MGINDLADSINIGRGQLSVFGDSNPKDKVIHLGRVVENIDNSNMGRIRVELISFNDNTGEEQPGKDRYDNSPKIAFPLFPQFVNIIPQVDELVYIIFENQKDQSSRRFYIGPIRSQNQPVSDFQSTSQANALFVENTFSGVGGSEPKSFIDESLSNQNTIYIKGKVDSDIALKSREVLIRAGTYVSDTTTKNKETESYIQIKQFPDTFSLNPQTGIEEILTTKFSQVNIVGSNINLISSDLESAQNRALDENQNLSNSNVETNTNPRLQDYGANAKSLHPLVLGDELVKVLKVLIRFCLNHKHTSQDTAYAPTEEISILNDFLADENISTILSKSVRTN